MDDAVGQRDPAVRGPRGGRHLHAMNRGVLITPFHNMALMSPLTREADVDRHTAAFREAAADLLGSS